MTHLEKDVQRHLEQCAEKAAIPFEFLWPGTSHRFAFIRSGYFAFFASGGFRSIARDELLILISRGLSKRD